jgi:shikimate kinase/3-dehydroquinate synthase
LANLHTQNVDLADRSYSIMIGNDLLAGEFDLQEFISGNDCLIVSNETVAPLYLETLVAKLPQKNVHSAILPDGEEHKTIASAMSIVDALVAAGANRDTTVIALGGGVVGDIAGFAAASYMRGVPVIQVPTTLLAQVDSSVGGKTGVNHAAGKNLIGAFHQPKLVLIDTATLNTLPDRELRAGLAEAIKHGAIADAEYFNWIAENAGALLEKDARALGYLVAVSCRIKAEVVANDEKERGARALLNFGHTFAHAIENSLGYGEWLHGEAVAAGMVMAAELSEMDSEEQARIVALIDAVGLPSEPPRIAATQWRDAMSLDKKVAAKRLRFVLLEAIGKAYVAADVSGELLTRVLARGNT